MARAADEYARTLALGNGGYGRTSAPSIWRARWRNRRSGRLKAPTGAICTSRETVGPTEIRQHGAQLLLNVRRRDRGQARCPVLRDPESLRMQARRYSITRGLNHQKSTSCG